MAKQDIAIPGVSLPPGGLDDTMPVAPESLAFFRASGFAIQNGVASRMTGKRLLQTLGEPILAIHSDRRNAVWIQTNTQLIYYPDFFHAFL